ncbi:unnamed protein product [Ceratitis capitata]|uniref:(Mediterranean fruit fly) hypothetical protein n=1 Tax=Ceratitis capitata TaxID=7213 RepID=A0A811UJ45_CERCA|nr:unnamed protein product [Ceratitis capitata]
MQHTTANESTSKMTGCSNVYIGIITNQTWVQSMGCTINQSSVDLTFKVDMDGSMNVHTVRSYRKAISMYCLLLLGQSVGKARDGTNGFPSIQVSRPRTKFLSTLQAMACRVPFANHKSSMPKE